MLKNVKSVCVHCNVQTGDVAQWVVGIQIRRPRVWSPGGAGWETVLLSLRVNSCADVFVPEPPSCLRHRTHICAHVKDPVSICRKRAGLTAGSIVANNTAYTRLVYKGWVAWLLQLVFLGESDLNFPWEKIPVGQVNFFCFVLFFKVKMFVCMVMFS